MTAQQLWHCYVVQNCRTSVGDVVVGCWVIFPVFLLKQGWEKKPFVANVVKDLEGELPFPVTFQPTHRKAEVDQKSPELVTFFNLKVGVRGFLGGGFKYFLFSPRTFGKWSNLTNIFQMGWNHQLVFFWTFCEIVISQTWSSKPIQYP